MIVDMIVCTTLFSNHDTADTFLKVQLDMIVDIAQFKIRPTPLNCDYFVLAFSRPQVNQ